MFFSRTGYSAASDPALHDAAGWCTYGQLNQLTRELACALAYPRKGLTFCFCQNDTPSVAGYLAALEAGHAVALFNGSLDPQLKANLIALYAPEFVLASKIIAVGVDYELLPTIGRNRLWRRLSPSPLTLHPDLTLLLSTSGSTGSPKCVRLTRGNILSNATSICQALDIRDADRAVSSLPLHYSYGLSVLHTHLLAGASVVLTDEGLMTPAFWSVVRSQKCTSFAGVPYSYQIINRLQLDGLDVPGLVTMTQAGGKLHNDLVARFHRLMGDRGGRFFVMYGQTEAAARIAVLPPHRLPDKLGSAGLPISGGTLAIDTAGEGPGELIYTGPNVMMGYASSREDLAKGDEIRGRLRTGDMARLDNDGFLYVLGRMKRDAEIFGLRLNLDEIEMMLRVYGPTAVVAGCERLMIFCEYGDEAAFRQYRLELASRLNLASRALHFQRVDALPLNSNGKIDYRALEAHTDDL
jgi:acyl-CoA synthetase (AMP-forming)/AMP-acid ligase II